MPVLPENRDAVITIQGGGIYGLHLLGQLHAVVETHKYGPLALAGTSAGAIVATLLWAGYTPTQIANEFIGLAKNEDGSLVDLLGPFEAPPEPNFSLETFKVLWTDVTSLVTALMETPPPKAGLLKTVGRVCWKPVRGGRDSVKALSLVRQLAPHVARRGFFRGDRLERKIEEMLRARPDVPPHLRPGESLTFRDFAILAERDPDASYRPPLLLTVTNLTTRRLELISSLDERYRDVPVSKAVRASAGFPVFFRPVDLPGVRPEGAWFVDGGVVSNFPIWAFSEGFRQQLRESATYDVIAPLPWIRLGLRVLEKPSLAADGKLTPENDVTTPYPFFKALISMLAGTARNQLEEIISAKSARAIVIRQLIEPARNEEKGFLDVGALNAEEVQGMIRAGFEWANTHLGRIDSPTILMPGDRSALVERELATMVARCITAIERLADAVHFRANVFIPTADYQMELVFAYNMDGDGDRHMKFPDLRSGLTGLCYMSRRPQLCNLTEIRLLRESNARYANLFGMPPQLQELVRRQQTWLASVPVFDPYEVALSPHARQPDASMVYEGYAYRGVETDLDGAVVGVLNLDSGWNYEDLGLDPDPNEHFRDPRVQFILSLMQASALSIGRILTRVFPRDEDEQ